MDKAAIKTVIVDELRRGGYPFPEALIHAIIDVESNWSAGEVNESSGASGLMQVMLVVVSDYNKAHKTRITLNDLRLKSPQSIVLQIRIGLWALAVFWRGAFKYLKPRLGTVPLDDLVKIADMFYVAGPGAARSKLNKLNPPTAANVEATFPKWTALNHVKKVWNLVNDDLKNWDLAAIDDWLKKTDKKLPTIAGFRDNLGGFVLAAIVVMLGSHFFARNYKGKKDV